MKRTVAMALMGAALMIPIEADAQRVRPRQNAQRYVEAPRSGRLVECRTPRNARAFDCRADRASRVVYRSSDYRRMGRRHAWVTPRWAARAPIYLPVRRARRAEIGQKHLRDILGRRMVDRIKDHGRRAGLKGKVRGHWTFRRGAGDVLVLTMRRQEVARLVDYDRDGLVDDVMLRNFRRGYAAW